MPTPEQLREKARQLIAENKLEFINCEPTIDNYGVDKKGEWIVLDGQKYRLNKIKKITSQRGL